MEVQNTSIPQTKTQTPPTFNGGARAGETGERRIVQGEQCM